MTQYYGKPVIFRNFNKEKCIERLKNVLKKNKNHSEQVNMSWLISVRRLPVNGGAWIQECNETKKNYLSLLS